MLNIGSSDDELRIAAYDLLCAVCTYLDFEGRPVVPSKSTYCYYIKRDYTEPCIAVFIPGHPGPFVTQLSEKLALFAPHLTLDFINEVAAGMDKTSVSQRINCLQYMGPWVKNLALFVDPANRLYEHSATKFRDCIRVLIDLTLADNEVFPRSRLLQSLEANIISRYMRWFRNISGQRWANSTARSSMSSLRN